MKTQQLEEEEDEQTIWFFLRKKTLSVLDFKIDNKQQNKTKELLGS